MRWYTIATRDRATCARHVPVTRPRNRGTLECNVRRYVEVFAAIMDFYASGEAIITDEAVMAASGTAITEDDDEIVAMIKAGLPLNPKP